MIVQESYDLYLYETNQNNKQKYLFQFKFIIQNEVG